MKKNTGKLEWLPMALLAVTLSSVLAFLYSKTQERDAAYFGNLALAQNLKQLDAEWELDLLKSKLGIDQHYDALSTDLLELNKRLEQLKVNIATQRHNDVRKLAQSSEALRQVIADKAVLIEHFKSHNSMLRNSMMFLPTAAEDLQRSLHAAHNSAALVSLSRDINKVLVDTMVFGRANATERTDEIQLELNALLQDKQRLTKTVADKLNLFGLHVSTVLREVQAVNGLLDRIAAVPTTARFEQISRALSDDQQQSAMQVQRYRQYLLLFSAGLITLLLYAAVRLIRSHAVINRVNEALQQANEGLEQRVGERTQELANSLSLLNATLDSTTDGILSIQFSGEVVCSNAKFAAMWGMPAGVLEKVSDSRSINFVISHMKDPEQFVQRIRQINANPEVEAFDVLELKDGRTVERYVRPQKMDGKTVGLVINFRDVTERKQAQAELENTHRQLLDASRQAGMAEVASNVLHNVGNVLNSVNVSANLVTENLKRSKVASLAKVTVLLHEHAQDLAAFITTDLKGKHLPSFLTQLCEHLLNEQQAAVKELNLLRNNIDHIKEIVAMQQSYSKVSGLKEVVSVIDLLEDTLNMNSGALERHGIEIIREFTTVPMLNTEKHKILQILVNLVRNAKYACSESHCADKRVILRVTCSDDAIKIAVIDNGVGISTDNLARIFSHGFTTRKDGHGFGLHSGALAARELGGSLHVHSDGPGLGASFTLELPVQQLPVQLRESSDA